MDKGNRKSIRVQIDATTARKTVKTNVMNGIAFYAHRPYELRKIEWDTHGQSSSRNRLKVIESKIIKLAQRRYGKKIDDICWWWASICYPWIGVSESHKRAFNPAQITTTTTTTKYEQKNCALEAPYSCFLQYHCRSAFTSQFGLWVKESASSYVLFWFSGQMIHFNKDTRNYDYTQCNAHIWTFIQRNKKHPAR